MGLPAWNAAGLFHRVRTEHTATEDAEHLGRLCGRGGSCDKARI
jgi:hypothetical protein